MTDEKQKNSETAVVAYQPKTAAMIVPDLGEAMEIIQEALGGAELTLNDLDVVKTPTGGAQFWTLPSGKPAEEIRGVPILKQTPRTYWRTKRGAGDEGSGPPDCSSPDGEMGYGKRFEDDNAGPHPCEGCPLNEWGTAKRDDGSPGAGKACSEKTRVFLAVSDDLRPLRIELAPTSGQNIKRYWLRQATSVPPKPVYASEAVFKLEKRKGPVQDYAVAVVEAGEVLSPEERQRVEGYRASVVPLLEALSRREHVAETEATADEPEA